MALRDFSKLDALMRGPDAEARSMILDDLEPRLRPVFERLCCLELPVPAEELAALLGDDGIADPLADLAGLRARGLLATVDGGERVDPSVADLAERSRACEAFATREGAAAVARWHRRLAECFLREGRPLSDLGVAARHLDAAGDRAGALGAHKRWAAALRDRQLYAQQIEVARAGLAAYPELDRAAEAPNRAWLWVRLFEASEALGRLDEADVALTTAWAIVAPFATADARHAQASVRWRQGRRAVAGGDVAAAQGHFEFAERCFVEADEPRDRAIVLGEMARLESSRGDWDAALALHEEELAVYRQLGDDRSRAVTLGDLARIAVRRGDLAGARRLQLDRLAIDRELDLVEGVAAAQFDLAQLDLREELWQSARERLTESWRINVETGRADGIAFAGRLLGRLLASVDRDESLSVLAISRDAFARLGLAADAEGVGALIAEVEATPTSRG